MIAELTLRGKSLIPPLGPVPIKSGLEGIRGRHEPSQPYLKGDIKCPLLG